VVRQGKWWKNGGTTVSVHPRPNRNSALTSRAGTRARPSLLAHSHLALDLHPRKTVKPRAVRELVGLGVIAAVLATGGCSGLGVDPFIRLKAPILALAHVRVIDGTGRPETDDQVLVIQDRRIGAVGRFGAVHVPSSAQVIDLHGRTVFPGLVGMHEHLFYQIERPSWGPIVVAPQATFAKLYLASGVTTIRTAGTVDFRGDLRMKRLIDEGKEPGPKIHITGPYLNAVGADPHPEQIAQQVVDAANQGATSFKAFRTLRSAELQAAIQAAHERGLRVTGHLCAVGFREAAALTFAYILDGGSVVQTDIGEDDGTKTIYRFNRSHYPLSETSDADGPAPITVTYDRNGSTNIGNTPTLSCLGPNGAVTRTIPLTSTFERRVERVKEDLIRKECLPQTR
jgi:hypothetical protein